MIRIEVDDKVIAAEPEHFVIALLQVLSPEQAQRVVETARQLAEQGPVLRIQAKRIVTPGQIGGVNHG